MRVFFSLIIFSFMLATCQGACFVQSKIRDAENYTAYEGLGKDVPPDTCDDHIKKRHLIGSTWNAPDCLRCYCAREVLDCCDRHGGVAGREGCKTVLNREKCEYEFYRLDDPSKLCGA